MRDIYLVQCVKKSMHIVHEPYVLNSLQASVYE
jgi:hypothetical protein